MYESQRSRFEDLKSELQPWTLVNLSRQVPCADWLVLWSFKSGIAWEKLVCERPFSFPRCHFYFRSKVRPFCLSRQKCTPHWLFSNYEITFLYSTKWPCKPYVWFVNSNIWDEITNIIYFSILDEELSLKLFTGDFSMNYKWQQVSSGLKDSPKYSSRF